GRVQQTTTPGATSYSASNGRSWLRYMSTNRCSDDRSKSGNPPKVLWEKSGDAQNSASAAAKWIGTSGRSRLLSPSASSPPTWSTCRWVITTSVTDAGSMPAASNREANRPTPGMSGNSDPAPESMSTVRPPLRTTTTFSGHLYTSGGRSLSFSQAATSAGSTLVANVVAGSENTPSLIISTSISPTRSA